MCYRENTKNFIEGCDRDITHTCTSTGEVFTHRKLLLATYCFQPVGKVSRVQLNISTTTPTEKNMLYLLIGLLAANAGSWVDIYFYVNDIKLMREIWFVVTNTSIFPKYPNQHRNNLLVLNCTTDIPQTFRLSAFSLTMIGCTSTQYEYAHLIKSVISDRFVNIFPACQLFSSSFGTNSAEEMKIISIQGEIKKVVVNKEYSEHRPLNSFCFNMFWLEDLTTEVTKRKDYFPHPNKCGPKVTEGYHCSGFSYCLNFTGLFSYIFLRESCPFYFLYPRSQIYTYYNLWSETAKWQGLKSWYQVSRVCIFYGGHLPVLRSKNELENLVAFIRKSPYIPILESLFLGLLRNTSQKVSPFYVFTSGFHILDAMN